MSKLTHLDDEGAAHMVDVSAKPVQWRTAVARGEIHLQRATLRLIQANQIAKGDVLLLSGSVRFYHGRQIVPREFLILADAGEEAPDRGIILPVYPATEEKTLRFNQLHDEDMGRIRMKRVCEKDGEIAGDDAKKALDQVEMAEEASASRVRVEAKYPRELGRRGVSEERGAPLLAALERSFRRQQYVEQLADLEQTPAMARSILMTLPDDCGAPMVCKVSLKAIDEAWSRENAEMLAKHPEHYDGLSAFYQPKRDAFAAQLRTTRFKPLPVPGGYFQLVDYSAVSELPEAEFCRMVQFLIVGELWSKRRPLPVARSMMRPRSPVPPPCVFSVEPSLGQKR